jgi:uncharacterized membrane protein YbhN (UPF0104 family)
MAGDEDLFHFLILVHLKMLQKKKASGIVLQYAVKTGIAVLAFWFIYKHVIEKENIDELAFQYKDILSSPDKKTLFIIVFILMVINWGLEALKWKLMMRRLETIPILSSLKAIFSGLTISFFTPNRIGEYAGRVFHLKIADRVKATVITIVENFSQLLVTMMVGSLSLVIYLYQYIEVNSYLRFALAFMLVLFVFLILLTFFFLPEIDSLILEIKLFRRGRKYLEVLAAYTKSELLSVFLLALLRYFAFTFQFYLLMLIFGISAPYLSSILLINMIFYVMTLVPTFALTELGVRGAVSTYFLSKITYDSLAILNVTISLWVINLVIPAVIGILFIFQLRFEKRTT